MLDVVLAAILAQADEPPGQPASEPPPATQAPPSAAPAPAEPPPAAPTAPPPPAEPSPPAARAPLEAPPPEPPSTRRPPRFDAQGELVVTGSISAGASYASHRSTSVKDVFFAPAIDWFVVDHVSLGAEALLAYEHQSSDVVAGESRSIPLDTTTVGGGLRVGVDARLGRHVSWWPRVTVGYETVHVVYAVEDDLPTVGGGVTTSSPIGLTPTTRSAAYLTAFAPILFHPAPHAFAGFGPSVDHVFTEHGGSEPTTLGIRYEIGTWFGGDSIDGSPEKPAPVPFGARGQWVFTNEAGGAIAYTTYSGVGSNRGVADLEPGFDTFVFDRASVGVFARIAVNSGASDTTGSTTSTFVIGAAGLRLGYEIPLASTISLWPRASVAAGFITGTNPTAKPAASADLYVPLLVHATDEGFFGIGPLAGFDSIDPQLVTVTTFGAALIVGVVL